MCAPMPTSPCGRESGRRRVLQFRAVLLRHRAHLCAQSLYSEFVERFQVADLRVCAWQSAEQSTTLGPLVATICCRIRAQQVACRWRKGALR
jgi:hypothetical protein